ncbi:sugar ABC transporter substrate-binding protein [Virgibacillus halophilus]|uniref:Sugar ABC transporter substrate-binding protein n=1 Tax=Tigheibacillus halophilus TaxID=361280 RepID=A0ABU5C409_9BACI|nr:sugar ABC transporter substrate-binding protein [Virgibacillus halophilus]
MAKENWRAKLPFWHSFTQGPRKQYIEDVAKEFVTENPKVKINIETFAWPEFYTKWTTGLQAGQVPDASTALPNHVVEMLDAHALAPVDDVIDDIGRNRFYDGPLREGEQNKKHYSVPLYSHAQVMWYRKDLLKKNGLDVPATWQELMEAADKINNPPSVYGLSVPMGQGDMMATRFLNFYVRSGGGTLLKDGKVDLTSDLAQEGIKYWIDMYKKTSPQGSINFKVLDQATLFYQGKTAFDFNSGFQIDGVATNSPNLVDDIAAAPIPKINENDPDRGIETSNIPIVIWKHSNKKAIAKAFIEKLYSEEDYIKFLHAVPGGMLPALKDVAKNPKYLENPIIQQFKSSIDTIQKSVNNGTAIGMENGPNIESGILTSQSIIEKMFQDIVLKDESVKEASEKAEKELNRLFEISTK